MAEPQTIRIGRAEYVVIPKAEYLRLRDRSGIPKGGVDAVEYARTSLAQSLREAREHAGLTQAALADKLGVTQSMVSQGESGTMRVSERYLRNVLKACGLKASWKGKAKKDEEARLRGAAMRTFGAISGDPALATGARERLRKKLRAKRR